MPRTKRPVAVKSDVYPLVKEFLGHCNTFEVRCNSIKTNLDSFIATDGLKIMALKMKYKKYGSLSLNAPLEVSCMNATASSANVTHNSTARIATKPVHRPKRSLSANQAVDDRDEDNRGASGDSITSNRGRRPSRSRAESKSTRVSRSLSRSKLPLACSTVNKNKKTDNYTTPVQSKIKPNIYGTVTPKVKPGSAQLLLRRPKQNEVAISLQGSPLMVNTLVTDNVANVNIPLQNGNVFSLQPNAGGLRMSQIPNLDEDTRRQLHVLRENLNKLCYIADKK